MCVCVCVCVCVPCLSVCVYARTHVPVLRIRAMCVLLYLPQCVYADANMQCRDFLTEKRTPGMGGASPLPVIPHRAVPPPLPEPIKSDPTPEVDLPNPDTMMEEYDTVKQWEIPYKQLQIVERVGEGSFGEVFLAKWHGKVAVKRLKVQDPTPEEMKAFENEVNSMRKTRHTNIVLYQGYCNKPPDLAIVTSWCPGKSLYECIHTDDEWLDKVQRDQGKWALSTLMQVINGMTYLHHQRRIIHRDLKSNNILLSGKSGDASTRAMIADFGLAQMKKSTNATGAACQGSVVSLAYTRNN